MESHDESESGALERIRIDLYQATDAGRWFRRSGVSGGEGRRRTGFRWRLYAILTHDREPALCGIEGSAGSSTDQPSGECAPASCGSEGVGSRCHEWREAFAEVAIQLVRFGRGCLVWKSRGFVAL